MGTCPDEIKRLIDRFDQQSDQVRSPDYNEATLRIDYVNPLFAALGWDIDNRQGFAEQYREVVHEDRLKRRITHFGSAEHVSSFSRRKNRSLISSNRGNPHISFAATAGAPS
jgi:hypothetical protein